jgi:lysozyme
MDIVRKDTTHIEAVFVLQKLLRRIGYNIEIDGHFGPNTDMVVKAFQSANRLSIDGIVGKQSWDMLFSDAQKSGSTYMGTDLFQYDDISEDFWREMNERYFFCFTKATEGAMYRDPTFECNIQLLRKHHILRGGYHFFRMMNENIEGQISNFLNTGLNFNEKGVLPPVLGVEPSNAEWKTIPTLTANREAIVKRIRRWLEAVELASGKTPIIYTTQYIWDDILNSPTGFEHYPLWVANYSDTAMQPKIPSTWEKHIIWQYSDKGIIGGNGGFDMNRLNIPLPSLLAMAGY